MDRIEVNKKDFLNQSLETRLIILAHEIGHSEAQKLPKVIPMTREQRQQVIDNYFNNLPFKEETARKFLKALVDMRWFYNFPWNPLETPLKEMLLPDEGLFGGHEYGLRIHSIEETTDKIIVKFSDWGVLAGGLYTFTLSLSPTGEVESVHQETHARS